MTPTDNTSARAAALVDAYRLAIAVQFQPTSSELQAPLEDARALGWCEVEFILRYGEYCHACTSTTPSGDAVHAAALRLRRLADTIGDPVLDALTISVEARLHGLGFGDATDEHGDSLADLATAVARLDESDPTSPCRGIAFVACGVAYGQAGSAQLEIDMYDRADESDGHLPDAFREIAAINRNDSMQNRVTGLCELACEQAERGERARAAELAALALEFPLPDQRSVPVQQLQRTTAEQHLLAALAQVAPPGPTVNDEWADDVHPVAAGYDRLAAAVRFADQGDPTAAADAAEEAVAHLESDMLEVIKGYALSIAARRPPISAHVDRYTRSLLDDLWNARQQLIGAARSRIHAEAVRIENARLTERAFSDELTGLANRHALARLQRALTHGEGDLDVGIVMVDVDEFKAINDRFGHQAGDTVLRRIAGVLSAHVRSNDLVVRLGGDEFIIVMQDVNAQQATYLADRLFTAVDGENWSTVAPHLRVGVSLGVAAGPVAEIDLVIERADRGLYISKQTGRGKVSAAST